MVVLQIHALEFPQETPLILNPRITVAERVQNKEDPFEDGRICFGEDIDHSEVFQGAVVVRAEASFLSTIWDSGVLY
jgi:hypothetical protein